MEEEEGGEKEGEEEGGGGEEEGGGGGEEGGGEGEGGGGEEEGEGREEEGGGGEEEGGGGEEEGQGGEEEGGGGGGGGRRCINLSRIGTWITVVPCELTKGVFTLHQKSNRIRTGLKPDRGNAYSMRIVCVHTAFLAQPHIYSPPTNVA